jgi:SAM-dependent methyltransferase
MDLESTHFVENLKTMNATERFSNRVENYRRYRPGYPAAVIHLIRETAGLGPGATVADVGSGTGILTKLLLNAGWEVYAIEPNAPMRRAAEEDLRSSPRFHSVEARAEATGLPDHSVDAITSAQAFHWFERDAAQAEFRRVLKPDGWVFLIWNERSAGGDFDRAYHEILASLGQAFEGVRDRANDKRLDSFFRAGTYRETQFPNPTPMNWEALRGRFLSSSYVPTENDPRHAGLVARLESIFREHQRDGHVVLEQTANVYFGRM